MAIPAVADSLAGRMETLTLLPLSQTEINYQTTNWIDNVFAGRILDPTDPVIGNDLIDRVLQAGIQAVARHPSNVSNLGTTIY